MFAMRGTWRMLFANTAFRRHVETISSTDVFFFLSHRHYLTRGLSRPARAAAALHHYEHETTTFDTSYFERVYDRQGLRLWYSEDKGAQFEIRLMPGNDVLHEGGCSVVLFVNGGRVCVISYSNVDRGMIFGESPRSPRATTLFVSRKQLGSNHDYQQTFNPAFDRCTPAHCCFAALTGIALAQKFTSIAAVRPQAHPGFTEERAERFEVAYAEFWESMAGRVRGPHAYEVNTPMELTPLHRLSPKARRRARNRRSHLEEIRTSAEAIIRDHLGAAHPSPVPVAQTGS